MIHSFNDIILRVGGEEIYASDFSAGSDGFTGGNGGNVSSPHTYAGETNLLMFAGDGTSSTHYFNSPSVFTAGKKYKVTGKFWVSVTNSLSTVIGVNLYHNNVHIYQNQSTNGWDTFEFEIDPGDDKLQIYSKHS